MENFHLLQKNNLWYGSFPLLEKAGFIHGCSCRLNGASEVVEDTLNLALHVGDNPRLVVENRRGFAKALGVNADQFTTNQKVAGSNPAGATIETQHHSLGCGVFLFSAMLSRT